MDVLEWGLRNGGDIPVGARANGVTWQLREPETVVVVLGDNQSPGHVGRDTWIVSHLKYPLMWVIETYNVAVVGRARDVDPGPEGNPERVETTREVFLRTGGLVDIHSVANRIIFVLPTKTHSQVDIGGVTFGVVSTSHRNELPADQVIPVYNMDEQINTMLDRMMSSHTSLRAEFSSYTTPYFSSGLDWLELDSLLVSIIVRWHQRIEGARVTDAAGNYMPGRLNSGAPLDVLTEYGMVAVDGITNDSYRDYGGSRAVTSLDHRVVNAAEGTPVPRDIYRPLDQHGRACGGPRCRDLQCSQCRERRIGPSPTTRGWARPPG